MKLELRRVDDFPSFNPDQFSAYPYDHFNEWVKPSRRIIKKALKKAQDIDGICLVVVGSKKKYVLGKYLNGFPRVIFFNATYQQNKQDKSKAENNQYLYVMVKDPFGFEPIFEAWIEYAPGQYV